MTDTARATRDNLDSGLRLRMRGEERRIAAQHEHLDILCREVYTRIDKDGAVIASEDFDAFHTAFEAHMKLEEDIYFPALHGLHPGAGTELMELVAEHDELRADAAGLRDLIRANDREGARLALDRVARRIAAHELAEEKLIARITEGPIRG